MAEQLTSQQKAAVENRGGKLLVSAAAGSGKTKVLVDRLLLYITQGNGQINVDDFLIITYTKAAAAELRGKIASKLNERLAEDPGNRHLQRQIQRLYLTKISTVHAFCADILREYAYRLDIPGDFRVADERECQVLQIQVLEKLMENAYTQADDNFLTFLNSHEFGRDDSAIPQLIVQVYNSARCHLNPQQWLDQCIQAGCVDGMDDVSQTVWGQYLIQDLHQYLDLQIRAMEKCAVLAENNGTMEKPAMLLRDTVHQLRRLRSFEKWDDIVLYGKIDYGRMVFSKSCTDLQLAEQIKAVRSACKAGVEKKLTPFVDLSDQALRDLQTCGASIRGLIALVQKYTEEYDRVKRVRRILDFGDLEHKMLDLVIGKNRQGPTALAEEISERFTEIMVDEYQDSNAVQDAIFSALTSKKQNCFMVGDVKQSIYQFRLADPGIFLEKYQSYVPAENAQPGQGRVITLSHNFRSAGPVLSAVNDVFSYCMSAEVGGLYYTQSEYLNEGIPHIAIDEPEIELCVIPVQEDTYAEEAEYTAERIAKLLDGTHMIRQGSDGLRPITADDIVILLRSPGSVGAEFQFALERRGIRVSSGAGTDLLQTEEVCFIRAMLQIIENPMQDIPLISALSSRILCFTADDLAVIRAESHRRTFYDALKQSTLPKAQAFMTMLNELRKEARLCTVCQLIDLLLARTRMDSIYASFHDGAVKKVNIQAFYALAVECENGNLKQLGQFLDYLESLDGKGVSVSAEHQVSGAVKIMSIHKSKGLEFPVVFLCGLSRDFNTESVRAQVLCNKDLGIGLNCVDLKNRVRYPSVAKKAIAAKILSDGLSEELRVLYVAMTRAKDRLIMTYAAKNPENDIASVVNRMDICDTKLLTSGVHCPGTWILLTALRRTESGALFALGGHPAHTELKDPAWSVRVETVATEQTQVETLEDLPEEIHVDVERLRRSLSFRYPHAAATVHPSKQTATQLKGRQKDIEAADNTPIPSVYRRTWRSPSFSGNQSSGGTAYGNTVHTIMEHIRFDACSTLSGVQQELHRLEESGYISEEALKNVDPEMIWRFFTTEIGQKLQTAPHILREFKFSILDDAKHYDDALQGEQILLQGVVDCAILEPEGITVLEFKTDAVNEDNLEKTVLQYKMQVLSYARAMERIYQNKVLSAQLYFFKINRFIEILPQEK